MQNTDSDNPLPTSPPSSGAAPAHAGPPPTPSQPPDPPAFADPTGHLGSATPPPPPPALPWGFAGETSWQPLPHRRGPSGRTLAIGLLSLFIVGIGSGVAVTRLTASPSTPSQSTAVIPTSPTNGIGGGNGTGTAPSTSAPADSSGVAAKVTPGIVNISITLSGGSAAGTGMVITSTGQVLTNNHVIDGETSVSVELPSTGQTYSAHVVGYDLTEDIALLQIDGGGTFNTVSIGNSSTVTVGEAVVALGNALGANGAPAVAGGTITALDQTITASDQTGQDVETVSGLLQIDAQIQPGDSGGPLVTSSGSVIGMDTAAQASAGSFTQQTTTIAYAIPINKAMQVIRQIQSGQGTKAVHIGNTRALLGVETQNNANGVGALVKGVQAGSPAAAAGIVANSVITALDGQTVDTSLALRNAIVAHNPGASASVTWTDPAGNSHSATVTLTSGPPA